MSPKEQLELWCQGKSIHNNERYYNVVDENDNVVRTEKMAGGECCPDFSCCNPNINTPIEERILFRDRPELRDKMLTGYLTQLISVATSNGDFNGVKARVISDPENMPNNNLPI